MVSGASEASRRAYIAAAAVLDPELPFITVEELGMLRGVTVDGSAAVARIAPTYSGCPAVSVIEMAVIASLEEAGFEGRVERQMEPAWTTDWITSAGREKLRRHGIAPPGQSGGPACGFFEVPAPACPVCGAEGSERISEFGSTACKALYRCASCREPFEYFKRI